MFINNINGVINKNLSFFFFPSETKTARIDQKSIFIYFFVFFLKIQDIKKSKTQIFERGSHKTFLGQLLTILQTSP